MSKFAVIFLLLLSAGCNSSQPLPPPMPVAEDPAARTKAILDAIEVARQAAYSRYLDCRAGAESKYNEGLKAQGTPSSKKKGFYIENYPGLFEKLKQQQDFDDTECRKVYEAELGLIQPRLQPPEALSK